MNDKPTDFEAIRIDNNYRLQVLDLEIRLKDALFEINRLRNLEISYNKLKEDNYRLSNMLEDCSRQARGLKPVNSMSREEYYSPQF